MHYRDVFDSTPDAVSVVRRQVCEALRRAGRDDLTDRAALAVSELAANAVRHAPVGGLSVDLAVDDAGVVIGVHDSSPAHPVLRQMDPEALDGRGLALVAAVSDAWGWSPLVGGKRVWCRWEP